MEKEKDDSTDVKSPGLKKELSDAGSYSYAAICAISLHELFGAEYDMPYSKDCIRKFVKHLELPKQVFETMDSLVSGCGSQSYQAYVELLMAEPKVSSNPVLIIQDLVQFAILTGQYDARTRVLVMHVAGLLGAPQALAQLAEENLGHSLLSSVKKETTKLTPEQQKVADKKQRNRKIRRYALIGLATVGGGALLGVTGGLAAPLIGAGVGSIIGGGAAVAIGSVAGSAILGSLFGLAGAGLTGYRMKRRVGEIEEFEFCRLTESEEQLHIAIAVSGWLNEGDDNFSMPWQCLQSSREQYFLRYESQYLTELGNAMDILVTAAMSSAVKEMLKHTVLRGLLAAIAWPASLLSLSHIIDNPWGTCLRRSAQVGRHLAEVLLTKQHGGRPVTLIGFSLGARVIFYCLRELADRMPGSEGIVQDAIMLGAPVTGSKKDWQDISTVVAGRIVNGFCRTDWMLKFLYRTTSVQVTIAGLNEIECDSKRVHNIDLTNFVSGHQDYIHKIETLLKVVGVRTTIVRDPSLKKSNSESVIKSDDPCRQLRASNSLPAGFVDNTAILEESVAILEEPEPITEQNQSFTEEIEPNETDSSCDKLSINEKKSNLKESIMELKETETNENLIRAEQNTTFEETNTCLDNQNDASKISGLIFNESEGGTIVGNSTFFIGEIKETKDEGNEPISNSQFYVSNATIVTDETTTYVDNNTQLGAKSKLDETIGSTIRESKIIEENLKKETLVKEYTSNDNSKFVFDNSSVVEEVESIDKVPRAVVSDSKIKVNPLLMDVKKTVMGIKDVTLGESTVDKQTDGIEEAESAEESDSSIEECKERDN